MFPHPPFPYFFLPASTPNEDNFQVALTREIPRQAIDALFLQEGTGRAAIDSLIPVKKIGSREFKLQLLGLHRVKKYLCAKNREALLFSKGISCVNAIGEVVAHC